MAGLRPEKIKRVGGADVRRRLRRRARLRAQQFVLGSIDRAEGFGLLG
jgi:hypothetical protein